MPHLVDWFGVAEIRNDVSGLKSLMTEVRGLLDQQVDPSIDPERSRRVNKPIVHACLPAGRAGSRRSRNKKYRVRGQGSGVKE